MFTTYSRSEIAFDPTDEPASPAGQRVWRFVEQEQLVPWFYVQVVYRFGLKDYDSMLMMYHADELKNVIDAQSHRMRVKQVQLVTPSHINGQPNWLMEPLTMVGIVEHPWDASHFLVYKVESGSIYSLRNDVDVDLAPFKILFSGERDLRM